MSNGNEGEKPAVQRAQGEMVGQSGSVLTETLVGLGLGMLYGLTSPIVGHPFDTIKTKMQADPRYLNSTAISTLTNVVRTEGISGLYKGLLPPLIGSTIYRGVCFSGYAFGVAASDNTVFDNEIPGMYGLRGSVLVGGLCSAAARTVVESPLEFMKVRQQTGQTWTVNNTGSMFSKQVFSLSQISLLYKGVVPTFFRTWAMLGTFFILIDYSVRVIPDIINMPVYGPFFKGGVCATAAWWVAWPFEMAKSKVQGSQGATSPAMMTVIRGIVAEKGVLGLYRGIGPGSLRSLFANGCSMVVYNYGQQLRESSNGKAKKA
jgi:solute carrier family 25 carnitine/acylcarnitine transporter 20/29